MFQSNCFIFTFSPEQVRPGERSDVADGAVAGEAERVAQGGDHEGRQKGNPQVGRRRDPPDQLARPAHRAQPRAAPLSGRLQVRSYA